MSIYFLDTEFVADGQTIMPISLALVPLDRGRHSLYLEFDFDQEKAEAHSFVRENVLPHLAYQEQYTRKQAAARIADYLGFKTHPAESKDRAEIWAYFASFDWVLFCQVFGDFDDLPEACPRACFDLHQLWAVHARAAGAFKPPSPEKAHHALVDAEWNREFYLAMVGESRA